MKTGKHIAAFCFYNEGGCLRALILTIVLLTLAFVSLFVEGGPFRFPYCHQPGTPYGRADSGRGRHEHLRHNHAAETQNKFVSPTTAGTLEAAKMDC